MTEPVVPSAGEPVTSAGVGDWLARNRKAILAALGWMISFVAATIIATDGRWPTVNEWIVAVAGALATGGITYAVPNRRSGPRHASAA